MERWKGQDLQRKVKKIDENDGETKKVGEQAPQLLVQSEKND